MKQSFKATQVLERTNYITNNATFDHNKQMAIRFKALEDGLLLGLSSLETCQKAAPKKLFLIWVST